MPDDKFTLKKSDKMIKDVIDSFFKRENIVHDIEELQQIQLAQEDIESGTEIPDNTI